MVDMAGSRIETMDVLIRIDYTAVRRSSIARESYLHQAANQTNNRSWGIGLTKQTCS